MKNKRIVVAATSLSGGGAERVAVLLANYFATRGYEVAFAALLDDKKGYELDKSVKYIYCGCNEGNKIRRAYLRSKIFHDEVVRFAPDCLISFMTMENILFKGKQPFYKVYSIRNDPANEFSTGVSKHLRRFVLSGADTIVFQTEDERDYFDKKIRDKGVIIGNPISSDLPDWNEIGHNRTIVAVGRLSDQKNFELLINAFYKFSQKIEGYKLVIYGEGELREKLSNQIEELGLAGSVEMPGFVFDIHDRMKEAAMYVSSSNYEGISNSMLEALAIGVPTICTDCPAGGARQSIKAGESGFLTEVGNAEDLSDKMIELAGNNELMLEFSRNSRKIRDELSIEKVCEKWVELLP